MDRFQVIPDLNNPQSLARWEHYMVTQEKFKGLHTRVYKKEANRKARLKYYYKYRLTPAQRMAQAQRIEEYNARYPQYPITNTRP